MKDKSTARWYLYVVAFVCGAAVLALEILGTRVIGPFYGVTIYLWSALITVTLLALAIGYAVGGRLADKSPSVRRLCTLIIIAGCWVLLISWLKHPVLHLTEPIGLRWAVLIASLILFAPPLTLLGMVSPLLVKISATRLNLVGSTVGRLYAVSTIGSVVAALATGYFLIPYVGVTRLFTITGMTLIFTAAFGLISGTSSKRKRLTAMVLLAAAGILLLMLSGDADLGDHRLLTVQQSPYGELRVINTEGVRYLLIDGAAHNLVDPQTWQSYAGYVSIMDLLSKFREFPGDLLMIGLGAGSCAKLFAKQGWSVDAVEIDLHVVELAQEYFDLQPSDARVTCTDGRLFLAQSDKKYDFILMDAFGSSSVPFHLLTREYFGEVADHLHEDGFLMINVATLAHDDPLLPPLAATLKSQFKEVWAFPVFAEAQWSTNHVMFASQKAFTLPEKSIEIKRLDGTTLSLAEVWSKRLLPDYREGDVMTDDLNRADLLSDEINIALRKELHIDFEAKTIAW